MKMFHCVSCGSVNKLLDGTVTEKLRNRFLLQKQLAKHKYRSLLHRFNITIKKCNSNNPLLGSIVTNPFREYFSKDALL